MPEPDNGREAARAYDEVLDEMAGRPDGEYGFEDVRDAAARMRDRWAATPEWIRRLQSVNHEWRQEAVPEAGRLDQAGHTAAEAAELLDMYVKEASYVGNELDEGHAREEAGDVVISLLSLLSMEGWDVVECIEAARGKNDDRDWEEHQRKA